MVISSSKLNRVKLIGFATTIIVLLLISLTALWFQTTIFNNQNFTAITSQALNLESSRQSIGSTVADRIFTDTPTLRLLLSDRLAGFIAELLAGQTSQDILRNTSQDIQLLLTSPRQESITIDLSAVKLTLVNAQELLANSTYTTRINPEDIPDQVTLIDTTQLPNFHGYAIIVLWLGPLSALAALSLLALWVYKASPRYRIHRLYFSASLIAVAALIAILTGPLIKPVFVAAGQTAPAQTLLRNIFEGFIAPFNHQAFILLIIAILLALSVLAWDKIIRHYSLSIKVLRKPNS